MGTKQLKDASIVPSQDGRGRPRKSQLEKTIDAHYRNLTKTEDRAVSDMEASLRSALRAIDHETERVLNRISRDNPFHPNKDLGRQLERLQALEGQARESLRLFGSDVAKAVRTVQTNATAAGQSMVTDALNATYGETNFGSIASFNLLPQATLNELVGTLSDGSPVTDLARSFGDIGGGALQEELTKGIALGLNPRQVAGNWRQRIAGVSRSKAQTIARTEMMRVTRESSRKTMEANSDVVKEWQWYCSLETRTCPVCWSLHGKTFPLKTKMATHPNCRCTMLPVTKSFEELGLTGIYVPTEDRRLTTPGDTLFRELPETDKISILGPAAYRAYADGAVQLTDFVGEDWSPVWGHTRHSRSLSDILGRDQAKRYYTRQPKPKLSPAGGTIPPAPKPLPVRPEDQWVADARAKIAGGLPTEKDVTELGSIIRKQISQHPPDTSEIDALIAANESRFQEVDKLVYGDDAEWGTPEWQTLKTERSTLMDQRYRLEQRKKNTTAFGNKDNVINHLKKVRPGYGEGRLPDTNLDKRIRYTKEEREDWARMQEAATRMPKEWVDDFSQYPLRPHRIARGNFNGRNALPGMPDPYVQVNISGYGADSLMNTTIHEMGHFAEFTRPGIRNAEREFYARRTAGESLVKLNKIFPGSGYGAHETTRRDQFLNPYMGKEYLDNPAPGYSFYELNSMGTVALLSDTSTTINIADDADFLDFMLGILAGK